LEEFKKVISSKAFEPATFSSAELWFYRIPPERAGKETKSTPQVMSIGDKLIVNSGYDTRHDKKGTGQEYWKSMTATVLSKPKQTRAK